MPKMEDYTGGRNPVTKRRKKTGWCYIPVNKNKKNQPGIWNAAKRLEAVATYVATGNLKLTGRLLEIPYETLKTWHHQEWWLERVQELRDEENIELSTRLTKMLDKSLLAVNDRIEGGDYYVDHKSGQVRRIPAKLKDVASVTATLIDKRNLLRKQPTKIVSDEKTNNRLDKLAEAFASFAKGQPTERVVNEIEGECEEVVEQNGSS